MSKRNYFAIVDVESTMSDTVADIAIVIVDKKGREYARLAALISGADTLFHMRGEGGVFNADKLESRYDAYHAMIESGQRSVMTEAAVNGWIARAIQQFDPILTAYNIAFDSRICANSGIDLSGFRARFCLWHCAADMFARTHQYRQFILDNHLFRPPTAAGNMTYLTNADVMRKYLANDSGFPDEPHTALEDILDYEIPILVAVLRRARSVAELFDRPAYNWRNYQMRDWFMPR